MSLKFLIDENARGLLAVAISRHARRVFEEIEVLEVGDPDAPPRGTKDPELLEWCEANGTILISYDRRTLPAHLKKHLGDGRSSLGILFIRRRELSEIAEFLVVLSQCSTADEWANQARFIP